MAGDHLTTVRLSALTDRFLAAFLKSLYLSSQSLEIACEKHEKHFNTLYFTIYHIKYIYIYHFRNVNDFNSFYKCIGLTFQAQHVIIIFILFFSQMWK